MVAELAAAGAFVIALGAEALQVRRTRRIARLAFGPAMHPRWWARIAPVVTALSIAALVWGLVTLLLIPPKIHTATKVPESEIKHLVLVLDVSPSMQLVDAGPDGKQSRRQRVYNLMESFFNRVQLPEYRTSVVAVYNGAKPVVIDTKDREVVNNILNDLPLNFAFNAGKTDLFAGLSEAAEIVAEFPPKTTTLLLLSDGDTVPSTGMPVMPASVEHIIVVGVGDPLAGKFLDGKQSRQDASTLRQIATRLGGVYHDGNQKHLSSTLIRSISPADAKSVFEKLTKREYALAACGIGAVVYALLPVLLHFFGTAWQPGVLQVHSLATAEPKKRRKLDRHAQPMPL